MAWIDVYNKDAEYKKIYGIAPIANNSIKVYILEFLIPRLPEYSKEREKLTFFYKKYNVGPENISNIQVNYSTLVPILPRVNGIPDGGLKGEVLAKIDSTDGNVEWIKVTSGLYRQDNGWVLSTNRAGKAPVGVYAVDFSGGDASTGYQDTGATGELATAFGWNTLASGDYSIAAGYNSKAAASGSFAMGYQAVASGSYSVAISGGRAEAGGNNSVAMGTDSKTTQVASIAIGTKATSSGIAGIAIGQNSLAAGDASVAIGSQTKATKKFGVAIGVANTGTSGAVLEVGVGSLDGAGNPTARANGFEVHHSGSLIAPKLTKAVITGGDDKGLITKEFLEESITGVLRIVPTISKTYAEMKALHTAKGFVLGQSYLITDFRTLWYIDDYNNTYTSDWGTWVGIPSVATHYGVTLKVEPIIVTAMGSDTLAKEVHSVSNPTHIIHYDAQWAGAASTDTKFFTAEATTEFRGKIIFRHDTYLNIKSGFDFLAVQAVRFTATSPIYNPATTYGRAATVEIADATGNAVYISLHSSNTGNTPGGATNTHWLQYRAKGPDLSGVFRDYHVSALEVNLSTTLKGRVANTADFKLFYAFAIATDLTNATGADSVNWTAWYFNASIPEDSNIIILGAGEGRDIIIPDLAQRVTIAGHKLRKINITSTDVFDVNLYGYLNQIDIRGAFRNTIIDSAYRLSVNALLDDSYIGGHFSGNTTGNWGCTISGHGLVIGLSKDSFLRDSTIKGSNTSILGTGGITNSILTNIDNCTIVSTFTSTKLDGVDGVTFPASKTFDKVVFNVPVFTSKVTLDSSVKVFKNVIVDRLFSSTTVEKLWYSDVDINGVVTHIELK